MKTSFSRQSQKGISMIEVLVTIVVLAFGILGLIGFQIRLQLSEMESYQRSQALILLSDMANRMTANRNKADTYVTGTSAVLGTGNTCEITSSSSRKERDLCEWSDTLKGASETLGGSKVGAFIGGRGCIESIGSDEYLITVAWQGMGPISAPPASVACGQNLYDDSASGAVCKNDLCRRTMTTVVRFAVL